MGASVSRNANEGLSFRFPLMILFFLYIDLESVDIQRICCHENCNNILTLETSVSPSFVLMISNLFHSLSIYIYVPKHVLAFNLELVLLLVYNEDRKT